MALRKETLISYVATDLTRTVSPILMLPTKTCTKFLYQALDSQHLFARSKPTYSRLTGLPWSSDGLEGPPGDFPIRAKPTSLELKRRHEQNLVVVSDAEATGCQWWPQSMSYVMSFATLFTDFGSRSGCGEFLDVSFCNLDTTYPNHETKLVIWYITNNINELLNVLLRFNQNDMLEKAEQVHCFNIIATYPPFGKDWAKPLTTTWCSAVELVTRIVFQANMIPFSMPSVLLMVTRKVVGLPRMPPWKKHANTFYDKRDLNAWIHVLLNIPVPSSSIAWYALFQSALSGILIWDWRLHCKFHFSIFAFTKPFWTCTQLTVRVPFTTRLHTKPMQAGAIAVNDKIRAGESHQVLQYRC